MAHLKTETPHLSTASDPARMRDILAKTLRPNGDARYDIRRCEISRIQHRKGGCSLQYLLTLFDLASGDFREQIITAQFCSPEQAAKIKRDLRTSRNIQDIPDVHRTFEPIAYIPDLEMLVQVFPMDHALPGLVRMVAGPTPELMATLLATIGPEGWHSEVCTVKKIRYRVGIGAVLRFDLTAVDQSCTRRHKKAFFIKVCRPGWAETTSQALEHLNSRCAGGARGFVVDRPVTYLRDEHVVVLERARGTSLSRMIDRGDDLIEAMRATARALAAFHQCGIDPARQHTTTDRYMIYERAGRVLCSACPNLEFRIAKILSALDPSCTVTPVAPTFIDFKAPHVFVDNDRVTFIDVDELASADPIIDPAALLAHLHVIAKVKNLPEQILRSPAQAFIDEYFDLVPTNWRKRFPPVYAGSILRTADGFYRRQNPGWQNDVERLVGKSEDALADRYW